MLFFLPCAATLALTGAAAPTGAASAAPSLAAGGISLPSMVLPSLAASANASSDAAVEVGMAARFQASSATGAVPSLNGAVPAIAGGGGRTFYVDFADGKDSNSGTSPEQPWRHAPGDAEASGNAKRMALAAGDTVRFRAGVPYRGTVVVNASGTLARPIVFTGSGYGQGRGVWDGADPVTSARKCPSQAACGGARNWRNLWLIGFAAPKIPYQQIYDAEGPLFEAMTPAPADAFWNDDIEQFEVIPLRQAAAVGSGRLENARLAAAARNEPNARLAIWVSSNEVQQRRIESVAGNTIYFDAAGLSLYKDRDGKAAIVGGVGGVAAPGLFALLGNGQAVVYPRDNGGERYFVGNGRYGIFLLGVKNVVVHGMDFVHGTAESGSARGGVAILTSAARSENVRIEGNRFYDFAGQGGQGVITVHNAGNMTIRGNRFDNLQGASGMRIGGNSTNLLVEGNSLRRLGRTGIYLQSVNGAIVRGNILSDVNSVHGNAISFYLGHQNVTATGNCVFNSVRPLTFHGNGASSPVANLKISGNILIANSTPPGRAAISSWGNNTRTVSIENNVAIGRTSGLLLNVSDRNVRLAGNLSSGLTISGSGGVVPPGWAISGNSLGAALEDAAGMTLTRQRCQARGLRGTLTVDLS